MSRPTEDIEAYGVWQSKLLSAESVDSVSQIGARAAVAMLDCTAAGVYVSQADADGLRLAGNIGVDSRDTELVRSGPVHTVYVQDRSLELDAAGLTDRSQLPFSAQLDSVYLEPLTDCGVLALGSNDSPSSATLDLLRDGICGTLKRVMNQSARQMLEREIHEQQQSLAVKRRQTTILEEVVRATLFAESQTELERLVCEGVTVLNDVPFAWFGKYEYDSASIEPSTWAGRETGYLDSVPLGDSESVTSEIRRAAIATGEVTSIQRIDGDTVPAAVATAARERGFESVAFVPVTDGETTHGLLAVYARQPAYFDESLEDALGTAGRITGQAFTTRDREQALLSDTRIEAEFRIPGDDLVSSWLSSELDCRVRFESMLLASDGSTLAFLDVRDADPVDVESLASEHTSVESVSRVTDTEQGARFKLQTEATIVEYLAERGIVLQSLEASKGVAHASLELPVDVDVREFVSEVQSVYPDAELIARHERERQGETRPEVRAGFQRRLTDRQHEVLQVAYHSGYFDWPRTTDGDALAETIGVAQSTMLQHLRAAERKLLAEVIDSQRSIYSK